MCPPPGGAAVCHRLPARLQAGLSLGWGGARGPVCEGHCSPCLCHSRLLWLLFFMWVFIASGLVSDTLKLHTQTPAPHLDTLTSGLSECVEVWGARSWV